MMDLAYARWAEPEGFKEALIYSELLQREGSKNVDGFHEGPACDGPGIRVLNVIADFNHEALAIEVDFPLLSERVIRVLKQSSVGEAGPGDTL